LLILIALYIRMRLRESPTFIVLEEHEQISEHPMREIFGRSLSSVLRGIGLRMAENGGSYLFHSLAVAYATGTIGVSRSIGPIAVAVGSLIGMVSVPYTGHLSDRFGRVPVYRFGAIVMVLLAFPGWWLISLGQAWLVIVVIAVAIGIGVNSMLGPQCPLLPELFGNQHRYLGVAVAREFSAVIAGGLAGVLGAILIAAYQASWVPLGIYTFVLAIITLATTFITPETQGRDLTRIQDALVDTRAGVAVER
jgi:MFS transporter, MHS family, metabolite:H+ symporter